MKKDFGRDEISMETQGIQAGYEIDARGAGSLDEAVGAIIKSKIELKKVEQIHIAIGVL
jgi:hypothetical protein